MVLWQPRTGLRKSAPVVRQAVKNSVEKLKSAGVQGKKPVDNHVENVNNF